MWRKSLHFPATPLCEWGLSSAGKTMKAFILVRLSLFTFRTTRRAECTRGKPSIRLEAPRQVDRIGRGNYGSSSVVEMGASPLLVSVQK